MAFPGSREETLTPASKIRSALLNAIQDAIVNLYTGVFAGVISATEFKFSTDLQLPLSGANILDPNATHTRTNNVGFLLAASVNPLIYPIELEVGMRITSYQINLDKQTSGARTITAELRRQHEDGTDALVAGGSGTNSDNSPGYTYLPVTGILHTVATQWQYYIKLIPSGFANDTARFGVVFYDRP